MNPKRNKLLTLVGSTSGLGSVGVRRGVNAELIGLNSNGVFGECQWVKHQLSALVEKVGFVDMKAESEGFDAIFEFPINGNPVASVIPKVVDAIETLRIGDDLYIARI